MPITRTNRWSLGALVARDPRPKIEIARDASAAPSTLSDVISGRRDASEALIDALAGVLRETGELDRRALLTDPFGIVAPLYQVLACARELVPHLNGHDFGLREAVAEVDRVEAGL